MSWVQMALQADILIAACGIPEFVKGEWIREGTSPAAVLLCARCERCRSRSSSRVRVVPQGRL
jgi:5,10-methylene-tetrahydrofolate dehydrogenase/methenyl tetrahydrofolate cyclohydrolase